MTVLYYWIIFPWGPYLTGLSHALDLGIRSPQSLGPSHLKYDIHRYVLFEPFLRYLCRLRYLKKQGWTLFNCWLSMFLRPLPGGYWTSICQNVLLSFCLVTFSRPVIGGSTNNCTVIGQIIGDVVLCKKYHRHWGRGWWAPRRQNIVETIHVNDNICCSAGKQEK